MNQALTRTRTIGMYSPGGSGGSSGSGIVQRGKTATQVGVQGPYAATFSPAISDITSEATIVAQTGMADASGEVIFATIERDTISSTGFSFWLSGLPTVIGRVDWAVLAK